MLQDKAEQLAVQGNTEQYAHARRVHAAKDGNERGERFTDVQCLIEEWESR